MPRGAQRDEREREVLMLKIKQESKRRELLNSFFGPTFTGPESVVEYFKASKVLETETKELEQILRRRPLDPTVKQRRSARLNKPRKALDNETKRQEHD
jgi:hypothetical protein